MILIIVAITSLAALTFGIGVRCLIVSKGTDDTLTGVMSLIVSGALLTFAQYQIIVLVLEKVTSC